jgi:D-alanyl-D-alanine carboxypeptidase
MEGFWKRMTCRFLGGIGHCRPSLPTVVSTVILFYVVHPAAGSALSLPDLNAGSALSLPDLNNDVNKLLNDPRLQKGRYGARAVDLAARQSLIDINGDALLIPAPTTKLITNTAALLRLSPHCRVRTVSLTNAPMRNAFSKEAFTSKGTVVRHWS